MDKMALYSVAKMYYCDNKGQQEIANAMGVSRPQVSRMLKEARELKIVDISLNMPCQLTETDLENELMQILHIDSVKIVKTSDIPEGDTDKIREAATTYAADYLMENLKSASKIGIGWGQTIYHTVLKIPHVVGQQNLCFLPLVGSAGVSDPCYQTNSIVDRIAEKFKSDKKFVNAPAFVFNPLVRQYMTEKNHLGSNSDFWEGIDIAFFSVGGYLKSSRNIVAAIGDDRTVEVLLERKTVGDILGNFINAQGDLCLDEEERICISIPFSAMLKIPNRVCFAIGTEKAECLLVAAKLNLYTELITDSYTAQNIIQRSTYKL